MILGLGIDIVAIERFKEWHTYDKKTLSKIYTDDEINYCLSNNKKTAERFAVRFAAKEAFYKAISSYTTHSFIMLARHIAIAKCPNQSVTIVFNWSHINYDKKEPTIHVSLSHGKDQALAMVILSS